MTSAREDNWLCPDCHQWQRAQRPGPGQRLYCCRCRHLLWQSPRWQPGELVPVLWAALMLWLPAVYLPLMRLEILGQGNELSLLGSVLLLWQQKQYLVALLLLQCSILMPLIMLSMQLLLCLNWSLPRNLLCRLLKLWLLGRQWSMLDVYVLSLAVAYVKLMEMGELLLSPGLACLCLLLLSQSWLATAFEPALIWRKITPLAPGGHRC